MVASPSFDEVWRRCSTQIRRGEWEVETASEELPIYTLVARLGDDIGEALHRTVEAMGIAEHDHYVYPPGDIHLTILYLTPYLLADGRGDRGVRSAITTTCDILEDVFQAAPPLKFTVQGLNLFPTTVLAQLHSDDGTPIRRVRATLARKLKAAGLDGPAVQGYERALYWDMCFANVVRFTTRPSVELVDRVERQRETEFGRVRISKVEFVRTDKILSQRSTELVRSLLLRQPVAGEGLLQ